MKRITTILTALAAMVCMGFSANASIADDWKEKLMAEKIAFLTLEVGLTPEEAQAFWPVYNQVEKEKDEAMFNLIRAHKEMSKALEEKKSEKEVAALLDKYLEAQKKVNEIENAIAAKYKAVLPVEKVAKLYVAEEKFRRQQIRRLHHGGEGKPQPKN
jgi:replicative superfamily II helicase